MASRTLPGLGLTGYWDLGYDGWKTDNDLNLLLLSVLCQAAVKSFRASVPGSPAEGDKYILTSGANAKKIAVYDDGSWVYITPNNGTLVFNEDDDIYYTFNANAWTPFAGSGGDGDAYEDPVRVFTFTGDGNIDPDTFGLGTIQGVTLEDGDRVGLGDQTSGIENLIYIARAGAWERATGFEDTDEVTSGTIVPVEEGTYGGTLMQLSSANPNEVGTDDLTWKNNSVLGQINFPVKNSSATSLTPVLNDKRRWYNLQKAGAQTFNIPTHASVALPGTTEIVVIRTSTSGTKTIQAAGGVYLNGVSGGSVTITATNEGYWLKKLSKTKWLAIPLQTGGGSAYTDEQAVDAVATAIAAGTHSGVTITYNDAGNAISFVASAADASDLLDTITGADTQGVMLYRGAAGWAVIGPGSAGAILRMGGLGANPYYTSKSGLLDEFGSARGSIVTRVNAVWDALAPGTAGKVLTSNGSGADLTWEDPATLGGSYTNEMAMDAIAAMFAAGTHTNITVTYNDAGDAISLAVSGISAYTAENAMDDIAAMFAAGTHSSGAAFSYNDAGNAMSLTLTIATLLDQISSTRGTILYRGASGWAALSPGTSGNVLQSGGAGADPSWTAAAASYTNENAMDAIAAMLAAGSHTNITVTYNDAGDAMSLAMNTALTGGFKSSSYSLGTVSSGTTTPDPTNGNMQHLTANGAFTLACPTSSGEYTIVIEVVNGASAGTISPSGFTKVNGDTYATTNGNKYLYQITKHKNYSMLTVVSLN